MSAIDYSRDRSVRSMFDRIAGRYDLLNGLISFRLDAYWRNQAIHAAVAGTNPYVLDLGTGTGDLALNGAKQTRGNGRFIGLDFSLPMLRLAQAKRAKAAHGDSADFVMGSAMFAPFKNTIFDSAMTAFVLRNISDLPLMFTEALRVLKPGGKFVSIDMFPPAASWFARLYSIYFYRLMPRIGGFLSHDPKAYRYLSDSVREFHSPEQVSEFLETAGFHQVRLEKFLGGAVCMHIAIKAGAAF
jgi:demethylmenaquinone methyltransferase / 2-methoxy-6-polyprenyl-1,4-benzoquinol methylase